MKSETTTSKSIDIEAVIKDKSPKLHKWIPKFIINALKRLIHQAELNVFLAKAGDFYGVDFTSAIVRELSITYHIIGLEHLPKEGRYIFAANHPLGGLDGIIMMDAIGKNFEEIKFPVNDILMNIENLKPFFLPVNKHGSQSQDAAKQTEKAYNSNTQILMFPAGLVSRKQGKQIADLEWKKSFVKKAIEHHRDIVPVFIDGRNSNFFYNLANFRKRFGIKINLEMLFLVDELFKQRGNTITLRFGKPIPYKELKGGKNHKETAAKIKAIVYQTAQ